MKTIRFVHAADLHLDSPFIGLASGAPSHIAAALRDATFEAYDAIIELCLQERVDALLIAGDIYDGADRSLRAQLRFFDGLRKLSAAGIRSFVCHGNHDPLDGWEAKIATPPGCHRFGPEVGCVPFDPDDPGRAVVYGYSYPTQKVRENISRGFARHDSAEFAIGLLHCNAGSNTNHEPYAPCSIDDLATAGMDYWALGHVHTRQVLREQSPAIVYPGNPQGRHPNETGARGVYLVGSDGPGQTRLTFKPVDRVRWASLQVDIADAETIDDLQSAISREIGSALDREGGRPIVYRLALTGRGELHQTLKRDGTVTELAEWVNREWGTASQFAWCEQIVDRSMPRFDREAALGAGDFLSDLLTLFDDASDSDHALEELRGSLVEFYQHDRAGRYLKAELPTAGQIQELLAAAETTCIDQLVGSEA